MAGAAQACAGVRTAPMSSMPRAHRRRVRVCASAAEPAPPLRVLITGSTKGLGLALADEFLRTANACVVVNSRSAERCEAAVAQLSAAHGAARVRGIAADVAVASDVEELARFARDELGGVDVWLNNAGSNGYVYANLAATDTATLAAVVSTNLLGTLLCCRAAYLLMASQPGGGCIFNMEGAGSDGSKTTKYAAYGATKAAIPQLTRTLAAEFADAPVGVHALSPGMVQTELISCGKDAFGSGGRFFVNALSEPPAVAAAIIVPQVLALAAAPRRAGEASKRIAVLTPLVAATKLARRLVLQENKDRYYAE